MRHDFAAARADFILVARTDINTGEKDFPNAAFRSLTHRVAATVPGVEITDDADALGIRRPDGEGDAVDAIDLARVCAKPFKRAKMGAFGQQPNVHLAQHRREAVRIVGFLNAAGPDDA